MGQDVFEHSERLLDERGRLLGCRIRIAAGKSGVAIGFPRDPLIHLSWWVLAALAAVIVVRRSGNR
jgi:hypothetical protein